MKILKTLKIIYSVIKENSNHKVVRQRRRSISGVTTKIYCSPDKDFDGSNFKMHELTERKNCDYCKMSFRDKMEYFKQL